MGDVGRGFYVNPDIPNIFKNEVIPLAGIVTPNQFELEALTGIETASLQDAHKAIRALHAMGPKVVLVTSFREGQSTGALGEVRAAASGTGKNVIEMLVSAEGKAYRIATPELLFEDSTMMAGSGDLTTAVFLSRYLETLDIRRTLELTAASVYGIMEATHKARSRELLLIAAQDELISPVNSFQAEQL
jgi:pyridoxine kinase